MQRSFVLVFVAGLLAALGCANQPALGQPPKGPGGAPPPAAVIVATVQEKPIADSRSFVGTLSPLQRSTIGSAVDGRVIEVPVDEGDWVEQGQPLCRLLTRTIEIEIAGAKAELQLRQQEYEEMQAGSRPEEIARAKAQVEESRALMVFAQEKQRRWQKLFVSGNSTSKEEIELANSQALAAEQAFVAAQADYDLAVKGPREEKVAQALARKLFAEEQVNLLTDRLEKYTIKAPFDGYVVAKHSEQGEWIKSGELVAEVIAIDPIEVTVNVPENYIAGLQAAVAEYEGRNEAAPAEVLIDSFGTEPYQGQVVRIVPQADLRSRTFPVKVHVANPKVGRSHLLKAGMLASVVLPIGEEVSATLVPKDALVLGGKSPQVLVLAANPQDKSQIARAVAVETGLSEGGWIQVKGNIQPGQQVIVRGNERIRDGQPVQILSTTPDSAK